MQLNNNNPVVCHLRPIHKPNEQLLPHIKERSTLFVYGRDSISLGRNRDTQINYSVLSRHVCRIKYNGTTLMLIPLKFNHSVHVNGQMVGPNPIVLKNDDIISLHGQEYQYQVVHVQPPGQQRLSTTAPLLDGRHESSSSTSSSSSQLLDSHGLDDEFACPICLDILCHTHVCVPCSHIFCRDCIATAQSCPLCRTNITIIHPMKQIDQIIQKLILMGRIFSAEDVQDYLDKHPDWLLTLTTQERSMILNTRRVPRINKGPTGMHVDDAIEIED